MSIDGITLSDGEGQRERADLPIGA